MDGLEPAPDSYVPTKVLVRGDEGQPAGRSVLAWSTGRVLTAAGWVGAVMVLVALVDYALALFPTHFSNGEWEFGTIGQVFAGLPLLWLGLALVWLSGAGLGRRWLLVVSGVLMESAALVILVLLLAFGSDVPMALKTTPEAARLPVVKLVLKTVILGILFVAAYVYAGVLAISQARGTPAGEAGS